VCATCVAQGAAYLVPAYLVVKTTTRRRRRNQPDEAQLVGQRGPAASAERTASKA
jgi:hypothetical protein